MTMKSLIPLSIACMISASAFGATTNMADLNKDLDIMSTILKTSLKQSSKEVNLRVRTVKSTYLSGQGAVFSVSTGRHGFDLGGLLEGFQFNLPEPPDAPELLSHTESDNIVIDISDDVRFITDRALEQAHEGVRIAREKLRDLKLEERDLSYEQRELIRRKRDIEFENKRADEDRKNHLKEELVEIETELSKLDGEKREVKKYVIKLETESKEQMKEQRTRRMETRKQFLAVFEDALADTFCSYGAGLKSMSKDEKVNVILERFGEEKNKSKNANKDRIYVFKNSDIRACVADKITQSKLLEKAKVYYF